MELKLPSYIGTNWSVYVSNKTLFIADPIGSLLFKTTNPTQITEKIMIPCGVFKEVSTLSQRGDLTIVENLLLVKTKSATREYQQLPSRLLEDMEATLSIIPEIPTTFLNLEDEEVFKEAKSEFKELKAKAVVEILIEVKDNQISFRDEKSVTGGFEVVVQTSPGINYRGSFSCEGHLLKILWKATKLYEVVKTEYVSWLIVELEEGLFYYKIVDSKKDNKYFKDFDPISFI